MIDFTINLNGQEATMTFDKADSLANNIFFSLRMARGTFFVMPEFGSRLHEIKKLTPTNLALAESYCRDALQWMITTGRLISVQATAWEDDNVQNRMCIHILATKQDNQTATYDIFYPVV